MVSMGKQSDAIAARMATPAYKLMASSTEVLTKTWQKKASFECMQ